MKRKRRAGMTATFSVSIDRETKAILKARADRIHGGNMSALITELGRDAEKREAFERIRDWAGGSLLTEEAREAIDEELKAGWKLARDQLKKSRREGAA